MWEAKQQAALDVAQKALHEMLNFASKFEYGPVQRTIIELAMKKVQFLRN